MMPAAEDSTMCNEELLASSMAQSLRIPHAVARFLVARGVRTLTEAHRMLCGNADDVHDPFLMKGMEEAVAWLLDVRERGEKVFVFGDYDLDGMTAGTHFPHCVGMGVAELSRDEEGGSCRSAGELLKKHVCISRVPSAVECERHLVVSALNAVYRLFR